MKKKLISLLLSLIVILSFSISSIYADTNNKGKVIYLSLNIHIVSKIYLVIF